MDLEAFKEKMMPAPKSEEAPTELDPALHSLVSGGNFAPMAAGGGSAFGKVTWNKAI